MTENILYKVEYTNKHYFRDNTHISSDCFANAVEKTKLLSKQEGWKILNLLMKLVKFIYNYVEIYYLG